MLPCVWYQKGSLTQKAFWLIREHFSLEGPAVSTVSLQATLSFSFKPRNHSAVMNEGESGSIQEQGWQNLVSQQHTAGQWQKNGSKLGRPKGKKGLINGSCFGPNTQLADLTKSSVSPLPLFFPGLVKCLYSA